MADFTHLAAVGAMLDRARECISRDDLPGLVMSDPGSGGYVEAYGRVLAAGVPALFEPHEGQRLLESFDITENLLLARNDAGRSPAHRWFSVLTACIELLAWDGYVGLRDTPLSQSLASLLAGGFALDAADDPRAPLDLLPALSRELRHAFRDDRHLDTLALLVELLVTPLDSAEVEAKCLDLTRRHDEFQVWGDEEGNPNPWYAERPEFVWGAALSRPVGLSRKPPRDLPVWLELVRAHFPRSPPLASETADRLLREGAAWKRSPRRR